MPNNYVAVLMTRDSAKVWNNGLEVDSKPIIILPPEEEVPRHVRVGQFHHMHDLDHTRPEYFEAVASELKNAKAILLIGHGTGKSNFSLLLEKYLEHKHKDIAHKVVDRIILDVENLSDHEVTSVARAKKKAYINNS